MALDPQERKEVQSNFQAWLEIQDRRKELTAENKDLVEATANLMSSKSKFVSKMFKVLKSKMEDGEDEMEEIYSLITEIEGE